jgi:hypothetical protein
MTSENNDKKVRPINDPRIATYTSRTRSGSKQIFYTGNDERDWDRYRKEGGGRDPNVEMHDKPDTIIIIPPEKHYYAQFIGDEWWWVNGCNECNGNERAFSYVECDAHDVCSSCGCSRESLSEAPWGGFNGWTCKPCASRRHEVEKKKALEAMPDEFDKHDYDYLDVVKCPYCNLEFEDHEHYESSEEDQECPRCDNTFTVTAEPSITYNCEKK